MSEEVSSHQKRLIFVDDEEKILQGLERNLMDMEDEWEMVFVLSGKEALEEMKKAPFDVIISDMRMPEMDGAALLQKVKENYPNTIRFILSGYGEPEMIMKTINAADQFISKPCEAELLISIIKKSLEASRGVPANQVEELINGIDSLPTLPELYLKVKEAITAPNVGLADVGRLIQKDVSISAKILQVVNSAFFGLRREIRDVQQATVYLGTETIKSLIIMTDVFNQFSDEEIEKFSIQTVFNHCILVGNLASKIMKTKTSDKQIIERAMMAGMLHDIGKLIFIRGKPEEYYEIFKKHKEEKIPFDQLEKEAFGVSHADIGALLMGKWGLPEDVIKAIRFHHNSIKAFECDFKEKSAVYIANVLIHSITDQKENEKDDTAIVNRELKKGYMDKTSLLKLFPEWKTMAQELVEEQKKEG